MKLKNAMLVYTPGTEKVKVVPWPDAMHNALLGIDEYRQSIDEDMQAPLPMDYECYFKKHPLRGTL